MPKDSLRSIVYRSFVPCQHPRGVDESNTIRKSMRDSNKMEENIKKQKMQHNLITTNPLYHDNTPQPVLLDPYKFTVSGTEDLETRSSFQIMEVSKGAKKLNEVADSWSNRGNSDYIAKDPLKGALDLQESLLMLGKLQGSSKKKEKEKPEFMDFQKTRNSRDCYEELREIIKESFARQNLFPNGFNEKEFSNRKSNVDFFTDVPSSSSSTRSSLIRSSDFSPLKEKPKGPNLVAKLMGLEELPSQKQLKNEDVSRHLVLDIDLPKPRGNPRFFQKPAREIQKLEEMVETMQFKGLLEKNKGYLDNISLPPIVIMRSQHVLHEEKHIKSIRHVSRVGNEVPLNSSEIPGNCLTNEKLPGGKPLKQKLKDMADGEPPVRKPKKITNVQHNPSFVKIRHCKPLSPSTVEKETTVKIINNVTKMASKERKREEIKGSKSQESIKSLDLGKATISTFNKHGKESNVSEGGKHMAMDKQAIPQKTRKSNVSVKKLNKDKPDSKPSAVKIGDKTLDDDNLPITSARNIQGSILTGTASEHPIEVTDAYTFISDSSRNSVSCPCESSGQEIEDVKYLENDGFVPYHNLDDTKGCKTITNTRCLLLCSDSFVNHTNVLFDSGTHDPEPSPTPFCELPDADLLLDCAKEIVELKSRRIKTYRLSQTYLSRKPKCHLSRLVEEICDGIEDLRSYCKSSGDVILVDGIKSMLERDLWGKGEVAGGAWDIGWRNELTVEQVNEVANDLWNLVLSDIMDVVIREFML